MILSGRFGTVRWNSGGVASPIEDLISINGFTVSLATEFEEVTCYLDTNRVYVPGLPDISGTMSGFWNSDELALVAASQAVSPGYLELVPNRNEGEFTFGGPSYLDLEIDASLAAPKISSNFRAAGSWTLPMAS